MSNPVEKIIESNIDVIIQQSDSLAESGFYWRDSNGLKLLVSTKLEQAGFANGFSTRIGGVSDFPQDSLNLAGFDEDSKANIAENRRRFLTLFRSGVGLSTVWQTHSADIKKVDSAATAAATDDKADALISDLPDLLVGVKTADCVPILIADPETGSYAAVHAGWRGTVASIAAKAVDLLAQNYGARPSDMIAAIGPAAGKENYEIGQDVIDAFAKNFAASEIYFKHTRSGHALIDLHKANGDQLTNAGIASDNISIAPFCTIEHTDLFFSYRKENRLYGKSGRLLSVIGRK